MKAFKFFSGILYLAMLSVFLLACTDTPIFYTLEKAYAIGDDRGLYRVYSTVGETIYHGKEVKHPDFRDPMQENHRRGVSA